MVFNSLVFVVFLAVVLGLNYAISSGRGRKAMLLIASYLFYAAWNPPFVILLWISTVVDWFVARRMHATEDKSKRKRLLFMSLGTNLGLLAYFKYGGFLLENFTSMVQLAGFEYQPPDLGIILPVGISFYTFQTLSYTIDVYRGDHEPWPDFLDFALFVTFFPQLVAGPIVRAFDFLPQCTEPERADAKQLAWGMSMLVLGLFEKAVIADAFLAEIVDQVYWPGAPISSIDAWVGTLAFAGQIFCDFAGYSTCAIGVALCLGFKLIQNFNYPYAAVGFSDFWRRWHISLSQWLRDYLYISLGGNRGGVVNTYRNLMLTMLLGGLWHGASWNFVIWGALHGIYLVIERGVRKLAEPHDWLQGKLGMFLGGLATFYAVCVAWVFFRAQGFTTSFAIVEAMHWPTGRANLLSTFAVIKGLAISLLVVGVHVYMRNRKLSEVAARLPHWALGLGLGAMIVAIILFSGEDRAFIYFQF